MKDDRFLKAEVKSALDACLSGFDDMPSLRYDIMGKVRGEVKVKRKLSVGLVLAVVLILAIATALAAITLNSLYEKTIEKEGHIGLIQDWSAEDKVQLVDWMVAAGVQLDGELVSQLHANNLSLEQKDALAMEIIKGHYPARDGILTSIDIIAKDKGPIEYWSLDDQAWFSETIDLFQPVKGRSKSLLPDENDIAEEEAKHLFFEYYQNEYGLEKKDFDLGSLTVAFSESTFDDGITPPRRIEHWTFNVKLADDSDWLGMHITSNGEIIDPVRPRFVITDDSWRDDWYDTYAADDFWTIEGTCAFLEEWVPKFEELTSQGVVFTGYYEALSYLVTKSFSMPDASCIAIEKARLIADTQITQYCKVGQDMLEYYIVREALLRDDPAQPVYFFWYDRNRASNELSTQEQDMLRSVAIFVDGQSGEIVKIKETKGLDLVEVFELQ